METWPTKIHRPPGRMRVPPATSCGSFPRRGEYTISRLPLGRLTSVGKHGLRRPSGVEFRLSNQSPARKTMAAPGPPLTYREAGVDIEAGDALVERIKPFAQRTMRPEVLGGIGGFGALVAVSKKYREPVMVAGTDGVGTKLKLAFRLKKHDTIGIDLVAMSVNDILVLGAEPVFFLDYFACGKLDVGVAAAVVQGIAAGCERAGCALIGGETAEMPGMYDPNEYDLAGFAVGLVDKAKIIDGSAIGIGDAVIGLASSGPHSNGYSLVRRVVAVSGADLYEKFDNERTLGEALLE